MIIEFPQAVIVKITGQHAERYLQNRLSNDLKNLPLNCWQFTAALTPQGKVDALGTLIKLGKDDFIFYTDAGGGDEVISAIGRYKISERVEFQSATGFSLLHVPSGDASIITKFWPSILVGDLKPSQTLTTLDRSILLLKVRLGSSGIDVIIPADQKDLFCSTIGRETVAWPSLTAKRLLANELSYPDEVNSEVLLSECNLPESVSFTKGCYVGQEVVAKIDAVGKSPRRFILCSTASKHTVGDPVSVVDKERPIGKIVNGAFDSESNLFIYCCLVKNLPDGELQQLNISGATLTRIPDIERR